MDNQEALESDGTISAIAAQAALPADTEPKVELSAKAATEVLDPTEIELDFLDEEDEDETDFPNLILEIRRRCDAAQLTYDVSDDVDEHFIRVNIRAGRETRSIYIGGSSTARQLLARPFEKVSFVGDYEAICQYDERYIVASISSLGPGSGIMQLRRLFGINSFRDLEAKKGNTIDVVPPADHPNILLTLSLDSNLISPFLGRVGPVTRPLITIRNLDFATNERASHLLETIANALLFELDLRLGIPLSLTRYRKLVSYGTRRINNSEELLERPLQFPSQSYDVRALSLYWYGRGAAGLPLLGFLAFYQSIEFYFPTYSQNEAISRTRKILKDPRFSVHSDVDLAKLLNGIQVSRTGNIGDERSQLRDVVLSCVEADSLRNLLSGEPYKTFYTEEKGKWKQVSRTKIPLNDANLDLRAAVCDRMYDIRCRIVHAKSDGGSTTNDVLLPFSKEADQLWIDTQLVKYIATQTLIVSSDRLAL